MFHKKISQISIDRKVWDLGIKLLRAKNAEEFVTHNKIRNQLNDQLVKIENRLEKLLSMRLNEEITSDEYASQKKIFVDKKVELKNKLEDRDQSTANWLELAENFFETAFHAREVMEGDNLELKRELVKTVGYNLFLKNKKLLFSFKEPYDVLLKPEMRSSVYPQVTEIRTLLEAIRETYQQLYQYI